MDNERAKKYLKALETEPTEVKAYFDGGFHRGTAGLGVVIYYKQNGKTIAYVQINYQNI